MKQKIVIISAITLLLILVAFMVKDFFFSKPGNTNPYKFELDDLRKGDTAKAAFTETLHFKTGLEEIHGIATDLEDQIYVAGKVGVEIFNSAGKLLYKINTHSTPQCISVDGNGFILLGISNHVEVWNRDGKQVAFWSPTDPDAVITSIAVQVQNVFVADAGQKVVYRYDKQGHLLNKIGLKDPATGVPGFIIPSAYFDLGASKEGNLWVVNPGRHSFEKYNPDGKLLTSWGKASMAIEGFCGCCNPSNFAMIYDSLFVTSEKAIERVKIYNADGSFRCIVAGPDQFEAGTKGLDLAVDKKNRILVLDPVKMLIRIFEPK